LVAVRVDACVSVVDFVVAVSGEPVSHAPTAPTASPRSPPLRLSAKPVVAPTMAPGSRMSNFGGPPEFSDPSPEHAALCPSERSFLPANAWKPPSPVTSSTKPSDAAVVIVSDSVLDDDVVWLSVVENDEPYSVSVPCDSAYVTRSRMSTAPSNATTAFGSSATSGLRIGSSSSS
jgi:hypothetical protein